MVKPHNYWTPERVQEVALKYEFRGDFYKGSPTVYSTARQNGWLDAVCAHMRKKGTPKLAMDPKKVYILFSPELRMVYVGISVNPDRRWSQHLRRPSKNMANFVKLATKMAIVDAAFPVETAVSLERLAIAGCRESGWTVLNTSDGGEIGTPITKWTMDALTSEARKYPNKRDFRAACPNGYAAAKMKGWVDRVCSHMPKRKLTEWRYGKYAMGSGSRRWQQLMYDFSDGSYPPADKHGHRSNRKRLARPTEINYLSVRANESSLPDGVAAGS